MRVMTTVLLLVTVLINTPIAEAGDTLEYPVKVNLKAGTSADDSDAAVAALDSDADGDTYDVTHDLVGDVYTVQYVARFRVNRVEALSLQLSARTTNFDCALGLDLYKWTDRRWVKKDLIDPVTTSDALHSRAKVSNTRPYIDDRNVLARVRCTRSSFFGDLVSSRLRLITEI